MFNGADHCQTTPGAGYPNDANLQAGGPLDSDIVNDVVEQMPAVNPGGFCRSRIPERRRDQPRKHRLADATRSGTSTRRTEVMAHREVGG